MASSGGIFTVAVSGQVESAYIPQHDNLYCKIGFHNGPDWTHLTGFEQGISQISQQNIDSGLDIMPCVWNFPIDIAFKSTNVFGWPSIIITVYGFDAFGRDVVRGYGSIKLPTLSGQFTEYVPLFAPVATSPFYNFYGWVMGRLPEFLDSKFPAKNAGREMTRVQSSGTVKLVFTIIVKDLEKCGYVTNVE